MIASVLTVLILGFAFDTSSEHSSIDQRLPKWVMRLGSDQYLIRENAARELLLAGPAAIPSVRAGATSANPEIAERCRRLLPAIRVADIEQKTEKLMKWNSEPATKGLTGFERFISITGDTQEARQLYSEMFRNHHEIVETLERDPLDAAETMAAFTRQLFSRAFVKLKALKCCQQWHQCTFDHRSEVVLLLFFLSDQRFTKFVVDGDESMLLSSIFLQNLVFGPESSPSARKLFVHWYRNEQRMRLLQAASKVVVNGKMRELLPTMLHRLGNKDTSADDKGDLLEQIAKIGDLKLLSQIEPLLSNDSVVFRNSILDRDMNLHNIEAQLGDVALRICWQWAGRELADLGTADRFVYRGEKVDSEFFFRSAFENDFTRQEAQAKWKKLRAGLAKRP